ncbi:MAG: CDP-alcohol phosphatidyltransferase family protein [Planctomycetes bacterium]|nr:CDP-alcohol phosphatidyltransferase family protein [Planctomycetota bacterium]
MCARLTDLSARRPLATRSTAWARALAASLARGGASPNAISVASLVFAAFGSLALLAQPSMATLLATAACVQLRLLCNLLDGMVAVEGGRQTPTGALYNEVPDRVADSLFLVALGYAVQAPWLGWFAALAAALTAYIRVLGGSFGLAQDFRGPQAKPHRMAVLTAACVLGAFELEFNRSSYALLAAAWVIAVGSVLTCVLRTRAIARALVERGRA